MHVIPELHMSSQYPNILPPWQANVVRCKERGGNSTCEHGRQRAVTAVQGVWRQQHVCQSRFKVSLFMVVLHYSRHGACMYMRTTHKSDTPRGPVSISRLTIKTY